MKKSVWITVLEKEKNEEAARKLYQTVSTYGLAPAGHFWQDNLEQMAWAGALEELVKNEVALWIILGSAEALGIETVRYGLSLLTVGVHSQRGHGFPIILALTEGDVSFESLPTPLKGLEVQPATGATLGAKIAAKANMPVPKVEAEYRLDVYGVQGLGQWFEVGPAPGHTWSGVMFGTCGGEITAHGIGPAHKLPERSTLEYPMIGLKLKLGNLEYTANAVKNQLPETDSYYLRIKDYPSSILFGPMSEEDDAEVYVVGLK